MQMEAETLAMLILGFVIVILFSLVVIIWLWVKIKGKAYSWFLVQVALLIIAFFKFISMLIINLKIPKAMVSEENSLSLGIIGLLWACSMLCMLIGISKLSKEKTKDNQPNSDKEEYNPNLKKGLGCWQFVSAFAGGLILGWWYVKTDSILTAIFGHALNNSMGFIMGAIGLSIPGYNAAYDIAQHQPVWFDLLGVILLVGGIMWLVKLFNERQISLDRTTINAEETNL